MDTLVITSDNDSDLKEIIEFAKKLKAKIKKIDIEDIEDSELLKIMEVNRKKDYVSENDIMETLYNRKKTLVDECDI